MKMLRTVRFDGSDDHVFGTAAGPDEAAVSGLFAFWGGDPAALEGKARQAFANGFLGLQTFARCTFVTVGEWSDTDRRAASDRLATFLHTEGGAPDADAAARVAEDELAFAEGLANGQPVNTILAVSRDVDETGSVKETYRTIEAPRGQMHTKIWDVVDDG